MSGAVSSLPGSRPGSDRWFRRWIAPALLFAFGLAVSLYYGRRGYMPLDQSIVFDGGWRVLSGQVPFRDYHAPNGFTVHAMQAVCFAVGGVSWFTYCLHAALINGAFAVLVARLLMRLGLYPAAAYAWGALSALVLYPPFGVPYMDQHAFFFSFCGVYAAVAGRQREAGGRGATALWLGLPAILLAAGLSKQIPSIFALPIVLAVACCDRPANAWRRLCWMAGGAALAVGALTLAGVLAGVEPGRLDTYFRQLPSEVGEERLGFFAGLGPLLERMRYTGEALGLRVVGLVHGAAALGLVGLLALAWTPPARRQRLLRPIGPVLLGEGLLVMCLLFIALTSNQPQIGVPFVFLAAGLAHAGLEGARDSFLRGRRVWLGALARTLGVAVLALGLTDGWSFNREVNATRVVNDIQWNPETAGVSAPRVHPKLDFMRWQLPPIVPYGPRHLRELAEFLAERDRPFLLIGDASVLYGLTGQPSVAPSLWFQHGMTLPRPDDPRIADYEDLLLERMRALDVTTLVLEGEHTWAYTALDWFPRLEARVPAAQQTGGSGSGGTGPGVSGSGVARFGPFQVIDLAAPQ